MLDKKADLAGPGIGDYADLEKVLPTEYRSLLDPRETQDALYAAKDFIEAGLCRELGLMRVQVPLIVDAESGVNDFLDRDGSRTPVQFHISNDHGKNPIDAQVVQAATKWKRMALQQFGMAPGEGVLTDMRAVRKDYFLDHDHSAYVDQWDWERAITAADRNLRFLTDVVKRIWKVLKGAEVEVLDRFPKLRTDRYPDLPEELTFMHAEEILERYPDLPRKARETMVLQEYPAIFIYGIGWPLADGYPHEMRAADYDDWVTETTSADGRPMHGLNGDILVWNHVTGRRHELSSMGIRVDADSLRTQLEMSGQMDFLRFPYHQGIVNGTLPLSVGGGIGQSRTYMSLLKKAHLGEVSVTVWPKILRDMCAARHVHVLE
jgi:aspartate--ammonia ligase